MIFLNERLKRVRKYLDLTQQEFADKIGSKRNTVATYEMGRSEPSAAVISLVCKTFNVNETWLRTGDGEMFVPAPTTELDALAARYPNMTHETYVLVEKLVNLPKASQDIITGFMREVVSGFGDVTPGALAKDSAEMTDTDLHAELDRQLAEEKEAADGSSAFGHGSSGTAAG